MNKLCLRAAALLVLAGAVASCGGAAGPPKAPGDEAVTTPESALAALDLAEANLTRALGGSVQAGYGQQAAASAAPVAPPPPPPPTSPGLAQQPRVADAKPPVQPAEPAHAGAGRLEREVPRTPADPCSTACSALASMERAADHLCGLAGSADNRCASARERVKSATARVHAACPACAR